MEQEPFFTIENICNVKQFKRCLKVMMKRQRLFFLTFGILMILLGVLESVSDGKLALTEILWGVFFVLLFDLYIEYKCYLFNKSFSVMTDKYYLYEDSFLNISEGKGIRKEVRYNYDYIGRYRLSNDIIVMITNDSSTHFIDLSGIVNGDKKDILPFIISKRYQKS